ncbi:MAG: aminopeptidase P family protein [Hyphomicrobiales bacterium]
MFQKFEDKSQGNLSAERVKKLRAQLKSHGVDGFIIPRSDQHQGEYVAAGSERLAWITGFTGSAGAAIVTHDHAVMFTDGRYTVQVRSQTDDKLFAHSHLIEEPPSTWIERNASAGQKFAYDPWLHTVNAVKGLKAACQKAGAELVALTDNPIDAVWDDQPPAPSAPVHAHPTQFAGASTQEKSETLKSSLEDVGADAAVLTIPESIAWALNIRGSDVPHTPIALCFAILHQSALTQLFLEANRFDDDAKHQLEGVADVCPPEALESALRALSGKTVMVDPAWTADAIVTLLTQAGAKVIHGSDPCLLPKAKKNSVELEGARMAHIRDGAAVSQFLRWLDEHSPTGDISEIDAAQQLETLRAQSGELREISFDTISGAGANAALPHYRVTTDTNAPIEQDSFYLVDSGAQYQDGTTDITRTIAIGTPSDEMRDRYTRVLKGHIAIARARFPVGTSGAQIDTLARLPLWQAGLDFDHGTGHGVGSYLSVHEGPQRIAKTGTVPLEPGMILSNEPGYYKEGHFGIRIENLVIVTPSARAGEERDMLEFETITFTPIDTRPIDPALLDDEELLWLNAYHAEVLEKISPRLDGEDLAWLEQATKPIGR